MSKYPQHGQYATVKNLAGTDFNSLKGECGVYEINDGANAPEDNVLYIVEVLASNASHFVIQTAYDTATGQCWTRKYSGSAWSAWNSLADDIAA